MKEQKKLKVLVWADGPTTTTGFGRVTRHILKSVYETGKYDIWCLAINYFGITPELPANPTQSDLDAMDAYKNYTLIPASSGKQQDIYGIDLFFQLLENGDFDIVMIVNDLPVIRQFAEKIIEIKKEKKFKVIYHFPIDADSIYTGFLEATRIADAIVTNNKWAYSLVEDRLGGEVEGRLNCIYYGIEPGDFYEISDEEKDEFRQTMFKGKISKNDILIMRSDANQQRKDWFKTLQIVSEVAKHDHRIKLYVNTEVASRDYPLFAIGRKSGLKPGVNFLYMQAFTKARNLNQFMLNKLYNITDIGISTARGEGCGLFHYEMMSLGKPVLISNNTAHTEAIDANAAIGINCGAEEPQPESYDPQYIDVFPNDIGIIRPICSVQHGVEQLIQLAKNLPETKKRIYKKAKEFMKDKTWGRVGEEWKKLFETIGNIEKPYIYGKQVDGSSVSEIYTPETMAFQQLVKGKIEEARKEFTRIYKKPPPQINYIGKK